MYVEEEGVIEEQVAQAPEEGVNDDHVADDQGEGSPDNESLPDQGEGQSVDAVDEHGVPWKNRAMELQRKYQEASSFVNGDNIEKAIEKALSKNQASKQEEEVDIPTRIAQLRQFASNEPEHAGWAETEIEKLRDKQLETKFQTIRQRERQELEVQQRKQAAEQAVLSNPVYEQAFVTDAMGNKVLNQLSPLTQRAHTYLNDERISSQPEAVEIAFKLAYADIVMQNPVQNNNPQIKRENQKLKQATLVEGTGKNLPRQNVSGYQKAVEDARSNPASKSAQHNLVKEALRARGMLR